MKETKRRKNNLISSLVEQGFNKPIIRAFDLVKREGFVPAKHREYSYEDTALPIGWGQTISQPSTIAFMLTLLKIKEGQKILEVGSGSGYVLALISKINLKGKVIGVERLKDLFEYSKKNIQGCQNVSVIYGNGFNGLKDESPFDRILVSAAADEIPQELINQLNFGGILVMPIKNSIIQLKKRKDKNEIKEYEGFSFVPLIEY